MLSSELRPRAFYDLESAVVYKGQVLGLPREARKFYVDVMDAIEMLCDLPDLGRPFDDDLLEVKGMRTYLVGKYRLFYTHTTKTLTIWRIIHTSRDLDDYAFVELP